LALGGKFFFDFQAYAIWGRKFTIEGMEGHSGSAAAQRLARNAGPGVSWNAGTFSNSPDGGVV